ncbi:hypothetical protein SAMN05421684_7907 [Asanoa ishikariensis]|uniref:Uncharacterized protein n=1 Tax=Asanoa ishikariensis TaxID=137265 RepID=A0A1H3URK6_9ACTN|nr:hypothetical protein [Asanoa ishikariensis]SDZ65024.1 hypothetical protein SAMN05421684_7907 [Asanoa ishikariensis]
MATTTIHHPAGDARGHTSAATAGHPSVLTVAAQSQAHRSAVA